MNWNRIIMTRDHRAPDGTLRVEAGARGLVVAYGLLFGFVDVLFDADQSKFVQPEYRGHLCRSVPFNSTWYEDIPREP